MGKDYSGLGHQLQQKFIAFKAWGLLFGCIIKIMKDRVMLTYAQAAAKTGLTPDQLKEGSKSVYIAQQMARPLKSNFFVGAVLLMQDGTIVTGANWETLSDVGMCAEGTALGNLFQQGLNPQDVTGVFVTGSPAGTNQAIECTPCGGCRDRLVTFLDPTTPVITISSRGEIFNVYTLQELHPTFYANPNEIVLLDNFAIPEDELKWLLGKAYSPYEPGFCEAIQCVTSDLNDIEGASLQNASYSLATSAAGIVQHELRKLRDEYVIHINYILGEDAKPSAATLQRLREFCPLSASLILCNVQGKPFWAGTLGDALPHSFGPDNLVKPAATPDSPPKP